MVINHMVSVEKNDDVQRSEVIRWYVPCDLAWMMPRLPVSHKGMFGSVHVIGGVDGMVGASLLAARSALYCGSGKVFVHFLAENMPACDVHYPELMCHEMTVEMVEQFMNCSWRSSNSVLLVGPGLGQDELAYLYLKQALMTQQIVVLDADALNLLAVSDELQAICYARQAPTVLTPHPLEAARLLKTEVEFIQSDRLAAVMTLSYALNATVLLKGHQSLVANVADQCRVISVGNAMLAVGGSGDVLAGGVAALLAQLNHEGDEAKLARGVFEAVCLATWLHGKSAEVLVSDFPGMLGVTPSELMPVVRKLLNQVLNGQAI
jgi:ADP-dependent NAD(P)H-hydrate dehydratase / NAD(P)H-hydrate epimerase